MYHYPGCNPSLFLCLVPCCPPQWLFQVFSILLKVLSHLFPHQSQHTACLLPHRRNRYRQIKYPLTLQPTYIYTFLFLCTIIFPFPPGTVQEESLFHPKQIRLLVQWNMSPLASAESYSIRLSPALRLTLSLCFVFLPSALEYIQVR